MQSRSEIFAELRPALLKLARRILGSAAEAGDMVQEAYVRWTQAAVGEVRSPKSFLATIDTRLCLNQCASDERLTALLHGAHTINQTFCEYL